MTQNARASGRRHLDLGVLDALRGLAALYVMLSHARWLLWTTYKDYAASGAQGPGHWLAALSGGLTYAHQAVLLFFLLSGFCIHYRQARTLAATGRTGFAAGGYAWRRLRRLYPPLLVALALTAVLDTLGAQLNPDFYAGLTPYPSINHNVAHGSLALTTLVGNLLLQAKLAVPVFGTNGPLWSLAFEGWFYVLYPLVLAASARGGAGRTLAAVGGLSTLGLVAGQLVPPGLPVPAWAWTVLTYWVVWAAGALIAEAYVGRVRLPGLRWLGPLALLPLGGLAALAARTRLGAADGPITTPALDLAWSAGLAVVLAAFLLATPDRLRPAIQAVARRLRPLGDMSYSLYVLHFPWLAFLSAWWLTEHPRLPFGAELAVAGALSALLLGWLGWYLVERHSTAQRQSSPALSRPMIRLRRFSTNAEDFAR